MKLFFFFFFEKCISRKMDLRTILLSIIFISQEFNVYNQNGYSILFIMSHRKFLLSRGFETKYVFIDGTSASYRF